MMSSIRSVILLFLSMKMLSIAMVEKRASSCDIDPSIPCECTNPFLGTDNFFLGDPARLCESAKACYVKNLSGCADSRQSRGGGRCQSKDACKPELGVPSTGAPSTDVPTPTAVPTPTVPTPTVPTPIKPTPEVPVDFDEEAKAVDNTVMPALVPKCPGRVSCECLTSSGSCTMCEVGCKADCHDLTTDGTKCFSGVACNPDLLFEIDNGLECPGEAVVDAVEPTGVEPVEPTVVEPVEPTVLEPVEPTVVEPVEPTIVEPVEPTGVEPVEPTIVEPVEPTLVECMKICECVTLSEREACAKCEVDCLADCNDMSREGAKCFSEFACNKGLLFELDN